MGKTLKNGNRYEEKDLEEDFNKPDKLVFDKVGRWTVSKNLYKSITNSLSEKGVSKTKVSLQEVCNKWKRKDT